MTLPSFLLFLCRFVTFVVVVDSCVSILLLSLCRLGKFSVFSYLLFVGKICVRNGKISGLCAVSRKEVFQPHLPVRLPCYDLAPITSFTLGRSLRLRTSGAPGFHGLTGGVYKARERIHRAMADARLLANPASWGRVADPNPNWGWLLGFDRPCGRPALCTTHCNTCVAPDVRAVLI